MNLIGDPWIPVVFSEARRNGDNGKAGKLVGLEELYRRSDEIRDLSATPPQRVALMRLLLCITQAALDGPADEDEWRACRDRIVPASLAYLDSRRDKFELYGKQPFLQVRELDATKKTSVDKLDFALAAGNNATLFDQEATPEGRVQSDAWIALQLLTFQCFSPQGTIGNTSWKNKLTGRSSGDAPCIESSPQLTLIRESTLQASIYVNLVTRQALANQSFGLPIWDCFPDRQKSPLVDEIVASFLGRLVPLSRAVLISADRCKMILGNGLPYTKFPEARDGMATVIIMGRGTTEKLGYWGIDLKRHPWRELAAVLAIHHAGKNGSPYAIQRMDKVNQDCFDLWIGGIKAKKAKLIDAAESVFRIPMGLLQELALSNYTAGVDAANQGERSLDSAVKEYCTGKSKKKEWKLAPKPYLAVAIPTYWSLLDARCSELIELANTESDLEPWRKCCRQAMTEAYERACPHSTARQIEAFVAGRKKLYLKISSNNHIDANTEEGGEA